MAPRALRPPEEELPGRILMLQHEHKLLHPALLPIVALPTFKVIRRAGKSYGELVQRQEQAGWGDSMMAQIARDLRQALPA